MSASPFQPPSAESIAPRPAPGRGPDFRDPVGRVRLVGMVEGVSLLVLLVFSAIKRLPAGFEQLSEIGRAGVKYVGMTHGVLVMVFLLVLFQAWGSRALSGKKCGLAFIASLLPFGPFLIDRRLAESTDGEKETAVD